jgi:hypothetical protein
MGGSGQILLDNRPNSPHNIDTHDLTPKFYMEHRETEPSLDMKDNQTGNLSKSQISKTAEELGIRLKTNLSDLEQALSISRLSSIFQSRLQPSQGARPGRPSNR